MEERVLVEKVVEKLSHKPHLNHINEDDEYILDIVADALNDVKEFINYRAGEELDERLITPITDLCVIRLNLTGVEGISSSSKAGTSESYCDDIPKPIRSKLRKLRNLP